MIILSRVVPALLVFQFLGCFTQSFLSKDEPPPDGVSVLFHLRDSTHIKSPSGKHHRIEEGYDVIGTASAQNLKEDNFEGIILNDDIAGITVERYNPVGTAALIAGAGIVILLILTGWGRNPL